MKEKSGLLDVRLAKAGSYGEASDDAVARLLEWVDMPVSPGDTVLVKPNFLRADVLTCTNVAVIAAACRFLLGKGCKVTVGDSPGFGTAPGVAKSVGLFPALEKALGGAAREVSVVSLADPVKKPLSFGGSVFVSRLALEADHILNMPKLKAHAQMRVTASVKNTFGCVTGLRKAFLHSRYGDTARDGVPVFPAVVADILGHLPPMTTLLDGIEAMHVRGPSGGKPYPAHLLAVSASPVALDTVLYVMLGVSPEEVPLWREMVRRGAPGARPEEVAVSGDAAAEFDFSKFVLPENLMMESFNPLRLAQSTVKRFWAGIRDSFS